MGIEYKDNSAIIKQQLNEAMKKAALEIRFSAETQAKKNIQENENVDTGRLLSSITGATDLRFKEKVVRIGTNVFYAPYVEFGTGLYAEDGKGRKTPWAYKDPKTGETIWTSGQKPSPFLRPAKEELQERTAGIVAKHIAKVGK